MSFQKLTQAERITALETKVESLEEAIKGMEGKLDDLLALRNKGAGVFWLATSLIGTGILGVVMEFASWFKH